MYKYIVYKNLYRNRKCPGTFSESLFVLEAIKQKLILHDLHIQQPTRRNVDINVTMRSVHVTTGAV
jgi:hypothetical protein